MQVEHYTDAELEAMLQAAEEEQDEDTYLIVSGILNTREANAYAQDQEE